MDKPRTYAFTINSPAPFEDQGIASFFAGGDNILTGILGIAALIGLAVSMPYFSLIMLFDGVCSWVGNRKYMRQIRKENRMMEGQRDQIQRENVKVTVCRLEDL